jgi:hypothetical protein
MDRDGGESVAFEMPENELEPAEVPDKAAVVRYLKEGGLVAMLQTNLVAGQQPRASLALDPAGNLAYTLAPERSLLGGAEVPFFAVREGKVYGPKREEVIGFLTAFGLSRAEAADVVRAVGTAP